MEKTVPFVAKVATAKTRTKEGKDYFVYRMNIPKDVAEQLTIVNGDYLFLRGMKAKWYHMVKWNEMPQTWMMLPPNLKTEIELSGIAPEPQYPLKPTTSSTAVNESLKIAQLVTAGGTFMEMNK